MLRTLDQIYNYSRIGFGHEVIKIKSDVLHPTNKILLRNNAFWKFKVENKKSLLGLWIVAALVIFTFLYIFIDEVKAIEETKHWIPVNAVVLSSEPILTYSDEDSNYCPLIKVKFSYEGHDIFSNLETKEGCDDINSQMKKYFKGLSFIALINPKSPTMIRSSDFVKKRPSYILIMGVFLSSLMLILVSQSNRT